MNKKISLGAAISLMALTAAAAITITAFIVMNMLNVSITDFTKRASMFKKLSDVDAIVKEKYVGPIDDTSVTDYTIAGYMKGLGDKYGGYLDAADYQNIELSNEGQSIGIGVNVVSSSDGYIKVVSIIDGSPAQKIGIKVNDEITSIDGEDVKAAGYTNSVNLLKGSEGTTVDFDVLRGTQTLPFSVVRQTYTIKSVQSKLIGNVGYVKIIEFDSNTDESFRSKSTA